MDINEKYSVWSIFFTYMEIYNSICDVRSTRGKKKGDTIGGTDNKSIW